MTVPENENPGWTKNCWPEKCGPSAIWPNRTTSPPAGVADNWEEYVIIPYNFKSGTDNTRKELMRTAADEWRKVTCINLVERIDVWENVGWIEVGLFNENSCSAYLGYLGNKGKSMINLGWCKSMGYLGSAMHEIGHAIGMNHEQKRPDAQQSYFGHGPALNIHWENIGAKWVPQYLPSMSTYVGSADDGDQDPFVGYAPYDYGSIMLLTQSYGRMLVFAYCPLYCFRTRLGSIEHY